MLITTGEIVKQTRLEIGLKDALVEMPKFNKWLSSLLRNKEKLEEIAITTVNAECSAIIMNKVPEKLEDLGKFLIPCALQELNRTSALADSGASINLLPHSIYKKLGLEALTPTLRVDGFTFLADFVVVNFEPDPRVPIILGRPFLRTAKALIDLYEEKLTFDVGKEELRSISWQSTHYTLLLVLLGERLVPNFKKFADDLLLLDSLPPGWQRNPLFEENDKDVEIKSSFTLTSPEESEFEAYLERDLIPPGINLTLPPPHKVSSSNPTSPTLTGEKVCSWKTPMFFSLVQFVWKMMTRIAIRKKIICLLATYLHKKPKLLSRPESEEIKEKK
ncbi:reverse transcriptase domain-containing protein [Tanacetum coccineum]